MTDLERRFFLLLWSRLGCKPFAANPIAYLEVQRDLGISPMEGAQLVVAWELKGWWARPGDERLRPYYSGHFTLEGAKEVAYQAAQYVKGQDAGAATPPG